MKKLKILLLLAVVLSGCGQNTQSPETTQTTETTETTVEQGTTSEYVYEGDDIKVANDNGTPVIEGESEFINKNQDSEMSEADLAVGAIINSMYSEDYSVRYNKENNQYTVKASGEESNRLASMVNDISFGENQLTAEWEEYKQNLIDASKVYENFEGANKPALLLINPFNAHNIILAVQDGEIKYEFTEDLQGDSIKEGIDEEVGVEGLE